MILYYMTGASIGEIENHIEEFINFIKKQNLLKKTQHHNKTNPQKNNKKQTRFCP